MRFVAAFAAASLAIPITSGCAPGAPHDAGAEPVGDAPTVAPRSAEALPRSILGEAPPPQGVTVHYYAADPATAGYLAVPAGAGPHPAVILIHEWDGLVDRVRQLADDLAARGYVALAADLYSGRTGSGPQENRALVQEVRARQDFIIANLDAGQRFLRERPDVSGRVATMGWCFGGGIALSYALGGAEHDGTAIFYGSLVTDPDSLRALSHPVYGTFAAQDDGIPPDQVREFVGALRSVGIDNDVHIYDGVDHGFWLYVDRDPEARLEPARDAWDRLQAFLQRTIGS